jgi:hypothetical protein
MALLLGGICDRCHDLVSKVRVSEQCQCTVACRGPALVEGLPGPSRLWKQKTTERRRKNKCVNVDICIVSEINCHNFCIL